MNVHIFNLPERLQAWNGKDALRFGRRRLEVVEFSKGNCRWHIGLQTILSGRVPLAEVTMNGQRAYRSVRTAKAAGLRAWAAFKGVAK